MPKAAAIVMTRRDFLRVAATAVLPSVDSALPVPTGLGVGLPHQWAASDPDYYQNALGVLRPSWWVSWKYDAMDYIYPPYLPMVFDMRLNAQSNAAARLSHFGPRLWLCGNEPERRPEDYGSGIAPEEAADFSIWWEDSASGTWAGPGVLLGLQPAYSWLDAYLDAGGRVPAAWAVHNYGWTPDHWDGNLAPFLLWMQRRQVVRPVIVTECACWGGGLGDQKAIMDRVWLALEQGNIQAAAWYASEDPFRKLSGSDLMHGDEITELGHYYRGGAAEPPPQPIPNLKVHLPVVMG